MLTIEQAARAVSGTTAAGSRDYAALLEARSDLRTLDDALALSDGQDPDGAGDHAELALSALLRDERPLAPRIAALLRRLADEAVADRVAGVVDGAIARIAREPAGTIVEEVVATLADETDVVLATLRARGMRPPEAFANLVWVVERRPDRSVDIKLAAVTTDRRADEYVDGLKSTFPSAEVLSERILLDHLYGLRDTVQAMVVGAMMRARGLRRPPRSVRRPT